MNTLSYTSLVKMGLVSSVPVSSTDLLSVISVIEVEDLLFQLSISDLIILHSCSIQCHTLLNSTKVTDALARLHGVGKVESFSSLVVRVMLHKSADIVARRAVKHNREDIFLLAVDNGAAEYRLYANDACIYGSYGILVWLLVRSTFDCNNLLYLTARRGGRCDIVELLSDSGATNQTQCAVEAACDGQRDILEILLKRGRHDLNYLLRRAAIGGHLSTVQLLLESGAKHVHGAIDMARNNGHHRVATAIEEYCKLKTTS